MQKCSIALCLVPLRPSLLPFMVSSVSAQARVLPVSSYVWNAGTFHLSTTRDPEDQADQKCLLHVWGINGIIRTDKAAPTFSIGKRISSQHIAFTYLSLQPSGLDHGRITTKREQQDWHQQELWARLTCEFWQDWCSVTFSDLWSHHSKGFEKNCQPQFLSLTSRNCRKNFQSNHVLFSTQKPRWWVIASSHRFEVQSFDLLQRISM
jgi:hypothetical protein